MARVRVSVICALVLLLAAACSGGEEKKEEEETSRSSLTAVSRPIVDIVPAASIGEDGQPVDPALVFAPEAPLITVVAQVGEVTGSPLEITWSQVTDKGEKELFTHTVEVASFEAAYSVGKSPGRLTAGTYRVEATLEGRSRSTQFVVSAPEGTGAAGEGVTSGPPGSGDSGAVATPASDVVQQPEEAGVVIFAAQAPVDPDAPIIFVYLGGHAPGGGRLEGKATMGGSTRTVSYPLPHDGTSVDKGLDFNPCVHPGGSDLPGTKATFEAAVYKGNEFSASDTQFTTLGLDETPPVLEVTSDPALRSKVEPGQTITVSIVGRETREGTWQTGVKQIKLTDFDTGAVVGDHTFGEQALPCAQKAWSKGLDVPYTVPEDAPAEIRLVAEVFDFAEPRPGRGSFGLSYYTGEAWEGEWAEGSGFRYSLGCPQFVPIRGTISFAVADDGSLSGRFDWANDPYTCSGHPYPSVRSEAEVIGERTADGFRLDIFGEAYPLRLTRQGNEASGKIVAGGNTTHAITVRCVSCG